MGADLQCEYQPRSWRSVLHVNGVTVYAEEEGPDGEGGGVMVSAVVRASPEDTFKVGGGDLLDKMNVLLGF